MIYYANLLSPSMRRVWIEMCVDFARNTVELVTLHAEGVD